MSKEKTIKLIEYILMIVVGILFAVSIADKKILIYCVGTAILLYGLFMIVKSVYQSKSFIGPEGILGTGLIALGVATLCDFIDLIGVGEKAVSVIIAAVGGIFLLDTVVKLANHKNQQGITELIIGIILLALGLTLCLWKESINYVWMIFGILLAIYGVYAIVMLFTNCPAKRK